MAEKGKSVVAALYSRLDELLRMQFYGWMTSYFCSPLLKRKDESPVVASYRRGHGFLTPDEYRSKIELDFRRFDALAFCMDSIIEINEVKCGLGENEQDKSGLYSVVVKGNFLSCPSAFGSPFREDEKLTKDPFIASFSPNVLFPMDFTFSLCRDYKREREQQKIGYSPWPNIFPTLSIRRMSGKTSVIYFRDREMEIPFDNPGMAVVCQYLTNIFGSVLAKTPAEFQQLVRSVVATENRGEGSLASLLEKLFPRVPGSVMEQLLREIVEKIDANISALEREIALASFGYSRSEAVGRFRFSHDSSSFVFKIVGDYSLVEKECRILHAAAKHPLLSLYLPKLFIDEPLYYKGYALIVTEDMNTRLKIVDINKEKATRRWREKLPPVILHRLYIASIFHSHTRDLVTDPYALSPSTGSYLPREQLQETLEERIDPFYDRCVEERREYNTDKSLLIHNDMHDANWVHNFLIDFGNISRCDLGGGYHRDLVRILFSSTYDTKNIMNPDFLHTILHCYHNLRAHEEHQQREIQYEIGKEYGQLLCEIYTEALRARYITMRHGQIADHERYTAITAFAKREINKE